MIDTTLGCFIFFNNWAYLAAMLSCVVITFMAQGVPSGRTMPLNTELKLPFPMACSI